MRAQLPVGNLGGASQQAGSTFEKFANTVAVATGRPLTFLVATGIVVVWALSGPVFHYSDTWQLVINTGTTIITFLMVFLIQHTQNRDTMALQLKLDELIRATQSARDEVACIEEAPEEKLEALKQEVRAETHRKST